MRHPARSNMVPNTDKVNNPINNLENTFHSRRFANQGGWTLSENF